MQITDTAEPGRTIEPNPALSTASLWPRHESDEIEAVTKVLESGKVNALVHGTQNRAFEAEFASYIGTPFAIAVSNGTVSIELALRALGIGPGDEVIVPARSFFATTSAVVAVGALPVFADVEVDTQNIDPASVERLIGKETRAIVCVHLAGQPCDMKRLCEIAAKNDLRLIEDCAQAHGASFDGQRVGSFGDAGSFSFCTDKIMSTGGEGGMLTVRDEKVWRAAWAYKDHGKDPVRLREPSLSAPGEFRYLHDEFGSNFRMTEMQAAIGRKQLAKLDRWVARRQKNAEALLTEACKAQAVRPMRLPDPARHAYYKAYARLDLERLPTSVSRPDIIAALMAEGITCGSGACPDMSREAAFDAMDVRRDGDLPNARRLARETIMFQVDHTLSAEQTAYVGRRLADIVNRYSSGS
ncbi:MAG: DegT/DnrJ/EryC1/StrS family aminotransferase [Erythrobacter sp.]|uniref:DegT/DnrJ/EryC1/StrS family aminotransferase n=1 Tax=Erythrobacter sp. TaxID=1042 RepID=UPI002631ADEC|nr:DegT/DnrJ/EryC1/StrS family aminotransferase [Erythrobacter sp.]MDJ0978691.1 DegT/DnrJ/EryC1/StrS family aminotransferase [Erythrobacter sp.]